MRFLLIGLVALYCAKPFTCHCQDLNQNPENFDKIAAFPTRLFNRITSEDAALQKRLTRQTQKYLDRLARKEQRLKACLYQLDSIKAASLYAKDPQQQYQKCIFIRRSFHLK